VSSAERHSKACELQSQQHENVRRSMQVAYRNMEAHAVHCTRIGAGGNEVLPPAFFMVWLIMSIVDEKSFYGDQLFDR
jgi:hypothetical protein